MHGLLLLRIPDPAHLAPRERPRRSADPFRAEGGRQTWRDSTAIACCRAEELGSGFTSVRIHLRQRWSARAPLPNASSTPPRIGNCDGLDSDGAHRQPPPGDQRRLTDRLHLRISTSMTSLTNFWPGSKTRLLVILNTAAVLLPRPGHPSSWSPEAARGLEEEVRQGRQGSDPARGSPGASAPHRAGHWRSIGLTTPRWRIPSCGKRASGEEMLGGCRSRGWDTGGRRAPRRLSRDRRFTGARHRAPPTVRAERATAAIQIPGG